MQKKSTQFRELLKGENLIVAPGATTALFARLVENAGYPVAYATYYPISCPKCQVIILLF